MTSIGLEVRRVTALTASEIGYAVIIVLAALVMLGPLIGIAFLVRDIGRQRRTDGRNPE
jgi:hypothetical protein